MGRWLGARMPVEAASALFHSGIPKRLVGLLRVIFFKCQIFERKFLFIFN
jgi:hypothetical protein